MAGSATSIHGSCVLVGAAGVLIRGAPGSGKSSLALALMALETARRPVRLVADDLVSLANANGRLVADAPASTAGLIEVRGVGLVKLAAERRAVVRMVVDLVADAEAERMPAADAAATELVGVHLPRLALPIGVPGHADRVIAVLSVDGLPALACE